MTSADIILADDERLIRQSLVGQWKTMSKKARKEAKQEAKAKALGMTVAEMKAANNKKAAEKAGCDPEKWAKMSVKERAAFRREAKAKAK